jgi:hypothetical protein
MIWLPIVTGFNVTPLRKGNEFPTEHAGGAGHEADIATIPRYDY